MTYKRCPVRAISSDYDLRSFFLCYDMIHVHLPFSGGLMDQPHCFLEAVAFATQMQSALDQE